jgi:hypothetical protein
MDKHIVRGFDGSVDVDASAAKYAEALTNWVAQNEIPAETIAAAVNAVLDRQTGRVPVPYLVSLAANELGADATTFKALSDRSHSYITGQIKAGNLFLARGGAAGGGGVSRQPVEKKTA